MPTPTTKKMRESIEERILSTHQHRINSMLNIELVDCSCEDCTATLAFDVRDWMLNPGGLLHGGILTTFFDISMGILSFYLNGDLIAPTATLSVNFVRPVQNGERVLIKARSHHSGRTMIQTSASAFTDGCDSECAYATAIFSKSTPKI